VYRHENWPLLDMPGYELESSRYEPVAGSCLHGNEASIYMKTRDILGFLSVYLSVLKGNTTISFPVLDSRSSCVRFGVSTKITDIYNI
jgi:hypothetical protein